MKTTIKIEVSNMQELALISQALGNINGMVSQTESKPQPVQKCKPAPVVEAKKPEAVVAEEVTVSREELVAQAKELGITFRSDIKDATLRDRIIKAGGVIGSSTESDIEEVMNSISEEEEQEEEDELKAKIQQSKAKEKVIHAEPQTEEVKEEPKVEEVEEADETEEVEPDVETEPEEEAAEESSPPKESTKDKFNEVVKSGKRKAVNRRRVTKKPLWD